MTPSLKVVVAITSPIAFQTLKNQSVLHTCLKTAQEFVSQYGSSAHLAIAGSTEDLAQVADVECEKIQCDPNNLVASLPNATPAELLMIHDSQRALTKVAQFQRVLAGLTPGIDAVRPVSAFTETLKSIDADQFIEGTIDRNSMKRTSTPELIRSSAHLAIAGSTEDLAQVVELDCEKIECDPNNLVASLPNTTPVELVMFHDSQRALTKVAQFQRVLEALTPGIDAVRPVSAFTETLKSIDADQFIEGTIDRNSMKRISTPELIRYSAIDVKGESSTWFVPIKADAQLATVDADPESARINSEKEIELMKHLLDWN
jgi:2-C-methyl-D-erythritol 4-phosphate cytidylyltransferase